MIEKKIDLPPIEPAIEPALEPPVTQSEINRVLAELAKRGGRSKSQAKIAALNRNRTKRWEGHQKTNA